MASNFLALDVGSKRIGVALANNEVRFAAPLVTVHNDETIWSRLQQIVEQQMIGTIVVGLPRGMDSQETAQTAFCRQFAADLARHVECTIILQDEALTSAKAEEELKGHGKPYEKSAIDALAATYILEDYLGEST